MPVLTCWFAGTWLALQQLHGFVVQIDQGLLAHKFPVYCRGDEEGWQEPVPAAIQGMHHAWAKPALCVHFAGHWDIKVQSTHGNDGDTTFEYAEFMCNSS